jgi:hypothetical protein
MPIGFETLNYDGCRVVCKYYRDGEDHVYEEQTVRDGDIVLLSLEGVAIKNPQEAEAFRDRAINLLLDNVDWSKHGICFHVEGQGGDRESYIYSLKIINEIKDGVQVIDWKETKTFFYVGLGCVGVSKGFLNEFRGTFVGFYDESAKIAPGTIRLRCKEVNYCVRHNIRLIPMIENASNVVQNSNTGQVFTPIFKAIGNKAHERAYYKHAPEHSEDENFRELLRLDPVNYPSPR